MIPAAPVGAKQEEAGFLWLCQGVSPCLWGTLRIWSPGTRAGVVGNVEPRRGRCTHLVFSGSRLWCWGCLSLPEWSGAQEPGGEHEVGKQVAGGLRLSLGIQLVSLQD